MHFVEWTLLNNAHGHLMSIDVHLHDRVMEEFSSCAARRGLSVRNEVGLTSLLGPGRQVHVVGACFAGTSAPAGGCSWVRVS